MLRVRGQLSILLLRRTWARILPTGKSSGQFPVFLKLWLYCQASNTCPLVGVNAVIFLLWIKTIEKLLHLWIETDAHVREWGIRTCAVIKRCVRECVNGWVHVCVRESVSTRVRERESACVRERVCVHVWERKRYKMWNCEIVRKRDY